MKTHKFDVKDAQEHGIYKAILLEHLKFHQEANAGNPDLTFEGKPYAFIKKETIENMYSYMNYDSVRKWLKELEDDGIIESCKPHAKNGYHLKYYHVKGIEIKSHSNETTYQSLNETTSHSSILPSEEPYEVPCKSDVIEYFTYKGDMIEQDIPLEAENFINHYEEREWKSTNGKRIKSWKRQASTWNNNYLKFNSERVSNHKPENNFNPEHAKRMQGSFK